MTRRAVIAAGGTGGHMFPAQALAEALLERGWQVRLSTDERGARYAGGFPPAVERQIVTSATFARGGVLTKAMVPFRIAGGILAALIRMAREKPDVVVGFGGYPTIPALSAATLLKRPRMIHEQNGVLGRVNRVFATRMDAIACGTWPTALPEDAEGTDTGNPVRQAVADRAGAGYIPPGDYPMKLVIIGGSQGARILSDVVPAALAALPEPLRDRIQVVQQARGEDEDRVRAAYAEAGLRAEIAPFIHDVPAEFAEAQLVISRSGASSVADISVIGRPSILVPFAAATGDHQTANARGLKEAGAAVVLAEAEFTADRLAAEVEAILTDPNRASAMAQAALDWSKPDATERLVALVETLAGDAP